MAPQHGAPPAVWAACCTCRTLEGPLCCLWALLPSPPGLSGGGGSAECVVHVHTCKHRHTCARTHTYTHTYRTRAVPSPAGPTPPASHPTLHSLGRRRPWPRGSGGWVPSWLSVCPPCGGCYTIEGTAGDLLQTLGAPSSRAEHSRQTHSANVQELPSQGAARQNQQGEGLPLQQVPAAGHTHGPQPVVLSAFRDRGPYGSQVLTWGPRIALGLGLPVLQLHSQPKVRNSDIA